MEKHQKLAMTNCWGLLVTIIPLNHFSQHEMASSTKIEVVLELSVMSSILSFP